MFNYAFMLYSGYGIEMNKKEASVYYKRAADKGHVLSTKIYASMLFKGDGIDSNEQEVSRYQIEHFWRNYILDTGLFVLEKLHDLKVILKHFGYRLIRIDEASNEND